MHNVFYLIKLFTIYKQQNSEDYVVSKLALYEEYWKFMCRECFSFYIPIINCDTFLEKDCFRIICKMCKKNTVIKILEK
ncbi:hypothetical protein AAJ76_400037064 [Vairimorpha ceranae]|uniref:Uncharacterized protein n=1 Tax=Vairimorpha ceranae TaxID=40302 RepID=A0A0F9ZG48_9MICR|nr:hypothetical protein AAJ76_400037064 [Vairimorpha ceranae]KKO76319.1 hypothetical protein AAJ76_400037064 [Vairimorpha ceranae]